ncbi:MAG: DUF177 domain-containing protein [Bacteroidales bacterium]|nr:DUF177 domain-containing protein [Bacteroidales bacterium]
MGGLRQYAIPFKGLKDGKHDFNFVADNSFFEQFDSSEVKKGVVNVQVELIKHSHFLELQFDITGKVTVNCDRCLEPFVTGIDHQAMLYVRYGDKTHEQSEDLLILADTENEIRLAQYIYEYIILALPYQRFHPEIDGISGCNPEMVDKLNAHQADESENASEDPRWEKLKGLI